MELSNLKKQTVIPPCRAIRWTGSNMDEVKSFFGPSLNWKDDGSEELIIVDRTVGSHHICKKDWWIIDHRHGNYSFMPEATYRELYAVEYSDQPKKPETDMKDRAHEYRGPNFDSTLFDFMREGKKEEPAPMPKQVKPQQWISSEGGPDWFWAIEWTGKNFNQIMNWLGINGGHKKAFEDTEEEAERTGLLIIDHHKATVGDYVVKNSKGFKETLSGSLIKKYYKPINS